VVERVAMTLLHSVRTPPDARLIFIGDIHGCYDELLALLERVTPSANDFVISVGDIVNKGPHPAKCLDLWRARGYLAVKGNNELKLLDHAHPLLRFFARDNRDVLRRRELIRCVESWPLVLDFPDAGLTAVHGGFLPQMQVTAADVEAHANEISELRWIRKKGGEWISVPKEKKKKEDVLWAEKWKGERFVLYGHTPVRKPKFDRFALGLDTGCVYGGALTAAVFRNGEWTMESVQARGVYA
jgi:serine/threonine protein phosphatase 1